MKSLILCSYGLKPEHITLETIKECRTCDILFCDCVGLSARLGGILPDMMELEDRAGALSVEDKTAAVMGAFARHDKVGVMTYGHPDFLCSIADLLMKKCARAGIEVRVLPAISSTSELLSMAGVTALSHAGVVLTSAIGLPGLSPGSSQLHVFIFDFYALEDGRYSGAKADLAAHLERHYPKSHKMELLECGNHRDESRKSFLVGELDKALKDASHTTTLYIPPLNMPGKNCRRNINEVKPTAPRKRK